MKKIKTTDFVPTIPGFKYRGSRYCRDWGNHTIWEKENAELLVSYDKYFDEIFVRYWISGELPKNLNVKNASQKIEEIKNEILNLIK